LLKNQYGTDDSLKSLAESLTAMLVYVKEVSNLEEAIFLLKNTVTTMMEKVEECARNRFFSMLISQGTETIFA
jgi:hypothetical protein